MDSTNRKKVHKMSAPTLNKINADLAKYQVKMVRGNGYFYFAGLTDVGQHLADHIDSVFTEQLRSMSLEEWIRYCAEYITDYNEGIA